MPAPSGLPYLDQVASFIITNGWSSSQNCDLYSDCCKTCPVNIPPYCAHAIVINRHHSELLARYPELAL